MHWPAQGTQISPLPQISVCGVPQAASASPGNNPSCRISGGSGLSRLGLNSNLLPTKGSVQGTPLFKSGHRALTITLVGTASQREVPAPQSADKFTAGNTLGLSWEFAGPGSRAPVFCHRPGKLLHAQAQLPLYHWATSQAAWLLTSTQQCHPGGTRSPEAFLAAQLRAKAAGADPSPPATPAHTQG